MWVLLSARNFLLIEKKIFTFFDYRYEKDGEALLVLNPSEEEGMLEQLKVKKIPISKIRYVCS